MENDSTTDAADNQSDQQNADNQSDQDKATTDQQNGDQNADNLEKSDSTDNSGEDDNSNSNEEEDENSSASKFDDDLDEWAKKTNRAVPTTDSERKLLQEIRDGQREFSREQEAKKATAAVQDAMKDSQPTDNKQDDEDDEGDPLAKKVSELEASNRSERTARLQSEYFSTHPVTPEESKVMGEILKEKVDKGGQSAYDYWTNPDNLEDWHTLAKARIGSTTDTTAIETEAARKERVRIAKEQQANGPARNATSKVTNEKKGYNRTEFLKAD